MSLSRRQSNDSLRTPISPLDTHGSFPFPPADTAGRRPIPLRQPRSRHMSTASVSSLGSVATSIGGALDIASLRVDTTPGDGGQNG